MSYCFLQYLLFLQIKPFFLKKTRYLNITFIIEDMRKSGTLPIIKEFSLINISCQYTITLHMHQMTRCYVN